VVADQIEVPGAVFVPESVKVHGTQKLFWPARAFLKLCNLNWAVRLTHLAHTERVAAGRSDRTPCPHISRKLILVGRVRMGMGLSKLAAVGAAALLRVPTEKWTLPGAYSGDANNCSMQLRR
jgi:hypothetical protein